MCVSGLAQAQAQDTWFEPPSLPLGDYTCLRNQAPAFWTLRVLNVNTYEKTVGGPFGSGRGLYRVSPADGRVVFESGPLAGTDARLLNGAELGLNVDGGFNFSTRCSVDGG